MGRRNPSFYFIKKCYNESAMKDVVIIGAGVTGALIARELAKYQLDVLVIEKDLDVGNVTSAANSAIIHSGYDPKPGSLKAKLNVKGAALYPALCDELDVSYSMCGTLTVIDDESQWPIFKELLERSKLNGVEMVSLTKEQLLEMEPNISPNALGALYAKKAGIVNPFELVVNALENAVDNGVELYTNEEVVDIKAKDDHFVVKTKKGEYETKCVINAAGLYSDKIAAMVEDIDWNIIPRKGEYILLDHKATGLVHRPIFPLPSEKGKGILVAPTTSGNYYLGPSSEAQEDKDDYSTDTLTLTNIKNNASRLVPNLPLGDTIRVFAGLRSTPSTHDFIIGPSKNFVNFINVAGIESPGLASSPAIAQYVVHDFVEKVLQLEEKKDFNPLVRKHIKIKLLNEEQRNKLVKENPDYGRIVCNCEQVSLGELKDALSRSVPPHSIKGMKRRTRAGFGRCQGGYCLGTVSLLLAEKYGLELTEVNYDNEGSNLIVEKIKKVKND